MLAVVSNPHECFVRLSSKWLCGCRLTHPQVIRKWVCAQQVSSGLTHCLLALAYLGCKATTMKDFDALGSESG